MAQNLTLNCRGCIIILSYCKLLISVTYAIYMPKLNTFFCIYMYCITCAVGGNGGGGKYKIFIQSVTLLL